LLSRRLWFVNRDAGGAGWLMMSQKADKHMLRPYKLHGVGMGPLLNLTRKKQVTRAQKGFLASTPTWCVSRYKRALVQSTSRNRHSLRNHTRRKGGDQEEASHGAQSSRRGMLFLWHLILPPLFKMIRVSRHQTSYPKPASRNSAKRQACSSRRKLPVDVLPALLSLNLVPSIQLGGTFLLQKYLKYFDLSAENWI